MPLPTAAQRDPQWDTLFYGHASAEEAVTALILAERRATIDRDVSLLTQLWSEDALIVDGRNSVTPSDDYVWRGRAAILDRYQVAVFPFDLPPLDTLATGTAITITGNAATVRHGGDQWHFIKTDQRWWLAALHYQLPPAENERQPPLTD
ncbi:MAG: hypothetical protein R3E79_61925 [Caldilineaceae bacterium]